MIKRYRKKPVIIEAVQWDGLNVQEIKEFCGECAKFWVFDDAWRAGIAPPKTDLEISTIEGRLAASVGDFIIKGVAGEFYPCKPDIFEQTYDEEARG